MRWKILIILLAFLIPLLYFLFTYKQSARSQPLVQSQHLSASNTPVKPIFKAVLPSIDRVFDDNHTWIATLSAENVRTVIATGDIIPARSVNFEILQHKDFNWPYLKTYQLTRNADITLANLESPQIKNCPVTNEGMVFCGDYQNIAGLKFAGINIVSLANNHAGNHGQTGVKETTGYLKTAGIEVTGTDLSNLVIKNIRGIKFAFLGFNDISKDQPGVSNVNEEKIKKQISQAKKLADIVIVTYHWGIEYQDQPDKRQKYLAHLTIDAGADLVIGNHPHWIQPIEVYKNKLITYAHGNFVFDQMWSQKTREGVIGKYTFYNNQLIDVEYFPLQIDSYGQPYFLENTQKKTILDNMKKQSLLLTK